METDKRDVPSMHLAGWVQDVLYYAEKPERTLPISTSRAVLLGNLCVGKFVHQYVQTKWSTKLSLVVLGLNISQAQP